MIDITDLERQEKFVYNNKEYIHNGAMYNYNNDIVIINTDREELIFNLSENIHVKVVN